MVIILSCPCLDIYDLKVIICTIRMNPQTRSFSEEVKM